MTGEPCETCGDWVRPELPHQCDETFMLRRQLAEMTRERDEAYARIRASTGLMNAASAVGEAMLAKLNAAEARVSRLRAVAVAGRRVRLAECFLARRDWAGFRANDLDALAVENERLAAAINALQPGDLEDT